MKKYVKPELVENKGISLESVYAASGSEEPDAPAATCPKWFNRYNVDITCKAKCPYYIHVDGWGSLNDKCSLA